MTDTSQSQQLLLTCNTHRAGGVIKSFTIRKYTTIFGINSNKQLMVTYTEGNWVQVYEQDDSVRTSDIYQGTW